MTREPDDLDPRDQALAQLLRRALQDEAPPPALRARVLALQSAAAPPAVADAQALALGAAAARLLRRVVAQLLPAPGGEALPFAPAAGLRGGGARQWLYRAEDCEIDLRVLPREGARWSVVGQLFGELTVSGVVLEGPGGPRRADIGPTREFGFEDLDAGCYRLALQGAELELVVPQIDVGDAAA